MVIDGEPRHIDRPSLSMERFATKNLVLETLEGKVTIITGGNYGIREAW